MARGSDGGGEEDRVSEGEKPVTEKAQFSKLHSLNHKDRSLPNIMLYHEITGSGSRTI